jgi:hypothetical protein
MTPPLQGRRILVTGGATGIGAANNGELQSGDNYERGRGIVWRNARASSLGPADDGDNKSDHYSKSWGLNFRSTRSTNKREPGES